MRDCEVVVIGGGPAGCAAATLLARRSHRVALVCPERPTAGALAESVPPSTRKILSELGLLEAVERAGFAENGGNTVRWAGAPPRIEHFPEGERGFHTDRAGLERVLLDAAESTGVHLYRGATARDAREVEGGWTVDATGPDGEPLRVEAPWLLDATGRHGLVARHAGRIADRDTTTLALVRRFRRPGGWEGSDATHTFVESHPEGWAWSVPLEDGTRCVTAMVDQRRADLGGSDVETMLDAQLAATTHLRTTLEGAEPVGGAWACPASLYSAERFGRPGLLLVGDAGSFIDPLSSYGVKKALSSGWLAGVVAHTSLVDPPMTDEAVAFFDEREREVYRRYRAASRAFFRDAADTYGTSYWTERADAAERASASLEAARPKSTGSGRSTGVGATRPGSSSDPDTLTPTAPTEAEVHAAFDELRARPTLSARLGPTVATRERPAILGHRIVRRPHLVSERYPEGLLYVRGVDLTRLVDVAPEHTAVPDGWSAYNASASPVTLPDYLTALSTAFAAGFLVHDG